MKIYQTSQNYSYRAVLCRVVIISLSLLTFTGCTTARVGLSHTELRGVLLDYNEEQILDNLIRANNYYPMLHFDVTGVTAAITTEVGGEFSGITGPTRPFAITASPKATDALTVDVLPQTSLNRIYELYNLFAPKLRSGTQRPPSNQVHLGLVTKWEKDQRYYWVSPEDKEEFFLMATGVSVLRQTTKDGDAPASLLNIEKASSADSKLKQDILEVLRTPIPAGTIDTEDASRAIKSLENEFRLQRLQR